MNCFTLKSTSADGLWVTFTMADLPVPIDSKHFILMAKSGTPILDLGNIRRGDPESGLFEGDVILFEDDLWLVCYERGFYVINRAYIIKYFDSLHDIKVLGVRENYDIEIPLKLKKKHMFRYGKTVFVLQDIIAAVNGKLILNMFVDPIDTSGICQECAFTYEQHKVFFGDKVGNDHIHLSNGRITANGIDLAS